MAWVRKNKSGYVACYKDRQGRNRTLKGQIFTHKKAAENAAAAEEIKAQRRRSDDTMTWGEWRDKWLANRDVEPSTASKDRERIDYHLTPKWDDWKLADIARADVKDWVTELHAPDEDGRPTRKPATVNRIVGTFSKSLKDAVEDEVLDVNPAQGVRAQGGEASHERFLTKDELRRVVATINPEWQRLTLFLAYTGLRWGEASALYDPAIARRRVNRATGVITVAEVWDDENELLKLYPKGRNRREVPVPRAVLDAMPTSGHFVRAPRGGRPDRRHLKRALDAGAARAGVEPFRVHDLRHTYASWLVDANVPLEKVRELLGHKDLTTTQRYVHGSTAGAEVILSALA